MIEPVPTPAVSIRDLHVRFGETTAVGGIDLVVGDGEVFGLLGPNGAGKTTSFRMTTGQIAPNDGQVVFNGEFVVGNQWINPTDTSYQQAFPVPKRDVANARAILKEPPTEKPSVTETPWEKVTASEKKSALAKAMASESASPSE